MSKEIKPLLVKFNREAHGQKVGEIQMTQLALEEAFKASKKITDGELITFDAERVREWVATKSGMPHATLDFQLSTHNLNAKYSEFLRAVGKINHADLKYFTIDGETITDNDAEFAALEERFKTYFLGQEAEDMREVQKAVEVLNKHSREYPIARGLAISGHGIIQFDMASFYSSWGQMKVASRSEGYATVNDAPRVPTAEAEAKNIIRAEKLKNIIG